jgi:hypothetical protein
MAAMVVIAPLPRLINCSVVFSLLAPSPPTWTEKGINVSVRACVGSE